MNDALESHPNAASKNPEPSYGSGFFAVGTHRRPDTGRVTLRADSSPHSTVVTCTHCPSFRLVAATREAAVREALPHAASHDEQRAARELLRYRPGRR